MKKKEFFWGKFAWMKKSLYLKIKMKFICFRIYGEKLEFDSKLIVIAQFV